MNNFCDQLTTDLDTWQEKAKHMEAELHSLPNGTLYHRVVNGKPYLYHQYTKNGRQHFDSLSSNSYALIATLLRKKQLQGTLPQIKHNIRILKSAVFHLKFYDFNSIVSPDLIKGSDPYLTALVTQKPPLSSDYNPYVSQVLAWLNSPQAPFDFHCDNLKHTTLFGTLLRSKSEVFVANLFEEYGIAYRYEYPLKIGSITYYPDFTIFLPGGHGLIYWEHFGRTDDKEYLQKAHSKLQIYNNAGIGEWENLIVSYDKPNGAIDIGKIKKIFEVMLLPYFTS